MACPGCPTIRVEHLPCSWWPTLHVTQAERATRVAIIMILLWSMSSRLATPSTHERAFEEAGLPTPEVDTEEVAGLMPLEPLWDIFLPFFGMSIGVLGLQLTFGLSLAEPLLLLALPWFHGALHGLNESLEHWHLGGIFGHPMLVAQVIIYHAEDKQRARRPNTSQRCTSAYGTLVGAYALGAVVGSAMRQAVHDRYPTPELRPTRRAVGAGIATVLVACNLYGVYLCGDKFLRGEPESETEASPLLAEAPRPAAQGGMRRAASMSAADVHAREAGAPAARSTIGAASYDSPLAELRSRLVDAIQAEARTHHACEEIFDTFKVAYDCGRFLLARACCFISLTILLGPLPIAPWDLLHNTPLQQGFSVTTFDVAGVAASALLVPLALQPALRCDEDRCMHLFAFPMGAFACFLAVGAALRGAEMAFALTMMAAFALTVTTAFANVCFATKAVAKACEQSKDKAGVALGWGLLVNAVAQIVGTSLGESLYELRYGWLGVSSAAGFFCLLAWHIAYPTRVKTLGAPILPPL